MPATLAPELLGDLLRGEMGFNGLLITDATHMIGMTAMSRRCDAIPGAIAAGCDMILFANDVEEDMAAEKLGMKVFLLTDCIINKNNEDISRWPNGDFDRLKEFIKEL